MELFSVDPAGEGRVLAEEVEGEAERNNHQYVVVEVDETATGLCRDALVRVLQTENVLARKYFWPGAHRMEPYRSLFPHAGLLLPETERIAARVVVLPTGTAVSVDDVGVICSLIRAALGDPARVGDRVRTLPQG